MKTLTFLLLSAVALAGGWDVRPTGTRASFRGLSVVNATTAWVSGSRATFLRTTDGGTTWKTDSIAGKSALDLRDIHGFDATTAVAISAGEAEKGLANILRTTDGGATWTTVFTTDQKGVFFDAISFWDDRNGIVMSDPIDNRLFLLVTSDGGATWSRVDPAGLPEMLPGEAAFAASGTCVTVQGSTNVWIATGGAAVARVFRSTDRGRTWSVAETPVHSGDGGAAGIFSVAFTDAQHGIVVGGNYSQPRQAYVNVALTEDGGATWKAATGPTPPGYLSAVSYVPGTASRSLVAVGLVGTALSTDGGQSWTMADTLGYNAVVFAARDAGFAAGDRGRVSRWAGVIDAVIPVRKP
jgi:photosystem II stability/assembly factor-like uncharacterized protein